MDATRDHVLPPGQRVLGLSRKLLRGKVEHPHMFDFINWEAVRIAAGLVLVPCFVLLLISIAGVKR
jgi:hypothetical protein